MAGLSRGVLLFILLDLVFVSMVAYSATAGSRNLLQDNSNDFSDGLDKVEADLNSFMDSIWGGKCVTNDQCAAYVSFCNKEAGITFVDGECRPTWWIWVVVGVLLLLLLSACVCCICLCSCCSCLLDCLCCCCRNKGYTPANTG